MPITLKSTGGGSITLTTPSTASDYTLTFPAQNGTPITTLPGTSGNVLTSDGTNWVSQAPASSVATGTIVTYGSASTPSGYLACDGSTYTKSSYTALSTVLGNVMSNTWTRTCSMVYDGYQSVVCVNSKIFVIHNGSSSSYVSSDSGVTWTTITAGKVNHNVAWNGTRYVTSASYDTGCGYTAGINYSTDTATWTGVTTNVNFSTTSPVWTGSRFVVTNFTGTASAYSTDGVTWSAGGTVTGNNGVDLSYGNGVVVSVGNTSGVNTAGKISSSSDGGSTWTARTLPSGFATAKSIVSVNYINNLFVAVDVTGNIATSSDGATWSLTYTYNANTSPLGIWYSLTAPNRVAYNATDSHYYYGGCYSSDLVNWYAVPYSSVYGAYAYPTGQGTYYLGKMYSCASDGTRVYNFLGAVYNPYPYTTSTQFIVPNLSSQTSGGTYYYIKT
jgi:hypothetical protein